MDSKIFSIECHKKKTEVITTANRKGRRQYSEPITCRVVLQNQLPLGALVKNHFIRQLAYLVKVQPK